MTKKGQLFDPDGNPLVKEESASLAVEIQALVKTEVNTAMDTARQRLEDQSRKDKQEVQALVKTEVNTAVDTARQRLEEQIRLDKHHASTAPLAAGVQALVKVEVNTAMDTARQLLQDKIQSNNRQATVRSWIQYGIVAFIGGVISIALWYIGPDKVKEWTQEFVKANMNKSSLDAAAKEVVSSRMETFTNEKLAPLSKNVRRLEASIAKAEASADRLREEQKVIASLNRAEAFDKEAFFQLQELASSTNAIAPLAQAMLNKLQRTLVLDRGNTTFLSPREVKGDKDYSGPFCNDELAIRLLSSIPDSAINIIGTEKRMVFVPKLVEIAHTSKDLWTINRVSNALKNMVGVDFYPWDLGPLDAWWSKHQTGFTNWPFTVYMDGMNTFSSGNYAEALKLYEQLLSVDSSADQSRALAIACAIEIGDTNRVQRLNKNYSQKDGRWQQWAKCKILLSTDSTQKATEELAKLARTFPTFSDSAFMQEGNHVLRGIDWPLFHKLTQDNSTAQPQH